MANITWHTLCISEHDGEGPLVAIKDTDDKSVEGGTQIFIYMPNTPYLFANSTAAFERLNLNIQNARIFTSTNGFCMDTYTVLESNGKPVGNRPDRISQIQRVLVEHVSDRKSYVVPVRRKPPRRLKSFSQHVEAELINSPDKPYSTLEINCPDQTGILATVGKMFAEHRISLHDARITTLGERVEDLFFITDESGTQLTATDTGEKLTAEIKLRLKERFAA